MLRLEDLISSKAKVRILKSIALYGGLNMSRLLREAGLPWRKLNKTLRELVGEGILRESRYSCMRGRYIRVFRYQDTPQAILIKQLFQEWERRAKKEDKTA